MIFIKSHVDQSGEALILYPRIYEQCPLCGFRSVDSVQMSVLEFTMPIMMTQGSDGRLISVRQAARQLAAVPSHPSNDTLSDRSNLAGLSP